MFSGKAIDIRNDQCEMTEFNRNMTWLRLRKTNVFAWQKVVAESGLGPRDMFMFGARFCDVLGLIMQCDGCGIRLQQGQWYRCKEMILLQLYCCCRQHYGNQIVAALAVMLLHGMFWSVCFVVGHTSKVAACTPR